MSRFFNNDCPFVYRILRVILGNFFCALGTYIMARMSIGLSPWEALNQGFSVITGLKFGTISIIISMIVLTVNVLMRESIGLGTVLDSVLVGLIFDATNTTFTLTMPDAFWLRLVYYLLGMTLVSFGQLFYMSAGLGCGPRDAMMVGIGKRMKRIPIGLVNIIVLACVLLLGVLTKSPIGLGTLMSVVGNGTLMQIVFGIFRFDPRKVENEYLFATLKRLPPLKKA